MPACTEGLNSARYQPCMSWSATSGRGLAVQDRANAAQNLLKRFVVALRRHGVDLCLVLRVCGRVPRAIGDALDQPGVTW